MDGNIDCNWFKSWFDSPYYHILYANRNYEEAELFIDNLLSILKPEQNSHFLDLGCGHGRHSIYLNKKHFNVTGIDLSVESIKYAKQFENHSLQFYVHDMRKPFGETKYDFILNMFTSFGYFETDNEDFSTMENVNKALKTYGMLVLDFFNVEKIVPNIAIHEVKTVNGIEFTIDKKLEENFIVKNISFSDKGKKYHFQECVKVLTLKDFEKYFYANNLKIVDLRGNYNLDTFDSKTSDRLILFAKKNK